MTTFASPAINQHVGGWTRTPTWEFFGSLVQATTEGLVAPNRTVQLQHIKTAFSSAIGSIESFMNTTMHGHLRNQASDPGAIQDRIRKEMFANKVKK